MQTHASYIHVRSSADATGQLLALSLAVSAARITSERILFDLRGFFHEQEEPASRAVKRLLKFLNPADSSIIMDPEQIDKILKQGTDYVRRLPAGHADAPALSADTGSIFSRLYFDEKHFVEVAQQEARNAGTIGVFYQSGNGDIYLENDSVLKNLYLQDPARLLAQMEVTGGKFFICSDTELFIKACGNRFPGCIEVSPRLRLPPGAGSGRYPLPRLPKLAKLTEENYDPARQLAESFHELYLLGLCASRLCFDPRIKSMYPHNTQLLLPATNSSALLHEHTLAARDSGSVIHSMPIQFDLIKELVSNTEPIIFEIGCNGGGHTRQFIRSFPSGTFYCFEPDPRALATFKERIGDSPAVNLFDCAVGAEQGTVTFYQSSGWPDAARKQTMPQGWHLSGSIRKPKTHLSVFEWCTFDTTLEVPMTTIDTVCDRHDIEEIDFIWMDVQGAEKDVFSGAVNMLARVKWIYTEYNEQEMYEGQAGLNQLIEYLPGFRVLIRYKNDALLWNTRYPIPSSSLLLFHLNTIYLEKAASRAG